MTDEKARGMFEHLQEQARLITLAGITGYGNTMIDAAHFIESQQKRIKELELALSGKPQFYCQCGGVKNEG